MKTSFNFTNKESEVISQILNLIEKYPQLSAHLDMLKSQDYFSNNSSQKSLVFLMSYCCDNGYHLAADLFINKFLKENSEIADHSLVNKILSNTKNSLTKMMVMKKLFLKKDMIEDEKSFFNHYIQPNYKNQKSSFYHDYERVEKTDFILFYFEYALKEQKDYFFNKTLGLKSGAKMYCYGLLVSKAMLNEDDYQWIKKNVKSQDLNDYLLEDLLWLEKRVKCLDIFKEDIQNKFKSNSFKSAKISKLLSNDKEHLNYIVDNCIAQSDYLAIFIDQTVIRGVNQKDKTILKHFTSYLLEKDRSKNFITKDAFFILIYRLSHGGEKELMEKVIEHIHKNRGDLVQELQSAVFDHKKILIKSADHLIKVDFSHSTFKQFAADYFKRYLDEKLSLPTAPKTNKNKL